jgi:hypothetical protein
MSRREPVPDDLMIREFPITTPNLEAS